MIVIFFGLLGFFYLKDQQAAFYAVSEGVGSRHLLIRISKEMIIKLPVCDHYERFFPGLFFYIARMTDQLMSMVTLQPRPIFRSQFPQSYEN